MKKSLTLVSVLVAGVIVTGSGNVSAQGFSRGRTVHETPAGGVNGGVVSGVKGANGGAGRIHGFATDGRGNAAGGSAGAFKAPGGAKGARAGMTVRSADGSVHHQSGGVVSGASGTASTSGSFDKKADGTVSGSRSTQMQSKTADASYQGQTTYNATDGFQHSATCTGTEGAVVSCPGQK